MPDARFSLYAQVRIHGKVTDLDNQPLAYSTVRLLKQTQPSSRVQQQTH